MSDSSDVLIVGGGLAGMSMALMLSRLTDWSITLLEKRETTPCEQPDVNSRPISLAHASVCILQALGVWDALSDVASPIRQVLVTESGAFGGVTFSAKDWQLPALAHVVPIDFMVHALWQALAESRVRVITGASVIALDQDDEQVHVSWESPDKKVSQLDARCVIAADGANSAIRSLLGITAEPSGPSVTIDVGECVCHEPHQGQAEQRFVPGQGVLATLPLLDPHRIRFVWTRASGDSDTIAQSDDQTYTRFWQKQFRDRLSIATLERQAQHSLRAQSASRVQEGRVVLLGDAARTVPPLAAQGFNLTLGDAAALAETMVQADKTIPGSGPESSTLARYAQWRHRAKERLPRFLTMTQYAFAYTLPGLPVLRGAALTAIGCVPGLRRSMGRRLLGWGGRVPALARGVSVDELRESVLCHDQ